MRTKKEVRKVNGYRLLYRPDHREAMQTGNWKGYVYEHRFVASELIGRKLKDTEEVHHLDGVIDANSPCNLLVLEKSQHTKLHNWLRKGAPGSESFRVDRVNSGKSKEVESRCPICGNIILTNNAKYCSSECRNYGRRKCDWPLKEELENYMSFMSLSAIGRKFGVSGNSVKKWAKYYKLL